MTHRFSELMFTPGVKQLQETDGSRQSYARFEAPGFPAKDRLTKTETEFIAIRDSFYIATVSETGWPYVQHRGGEPGFLKVLDERTISFVDYPGNRQFISFGNIAGDDRVSLFLMDYPNQRRLKILGHGCPVDPSAVPEIANGGDDEEGGPTGRGLIISVEAIDWNCPKYITPRFTAAELEPLHESLKSLEAENVRLRRELAKHATSGN